MAPLGSDPRVLDHSTQQWVLLPLASGTKPKYVAEHINKLEKGPTVPSSEERLQHVPPSKPRTAISSGKLLLSCESLGTDKQDRGKQRWSLLLLRGAIPHASAQDNPTKSKLEVQGHPISSTEPKWVETRKTSNHSQEDSQCSLSLLGSTIAHAGKKRGAQMQNCKADTSEDTAMVTKTPKFSMHKMNNWRDNKAS